MTLSADNIHAIINPVAGNSAPPFEPIGQALADVPARTTIHLTKEDHSATACAEIAIEAGADLVLVYGGDGTVMEVANALHPHDIPLAILPGGTANVIAHELDIPQDTAAALRLIFEDDHQIRCIDAGKAGDDHFLLRTSIGWEAELSRRPTREQKSSWGPLAYTQAALAAFQDMEPVTYHITLDDGEEKSVEGINCSICNIGNVGLQGISISLGIEPDDGYLNVLVLQSENVQAMLDITQNMLASNLPFDIEERLVHYKAKKITVQPDNPQRMSHDGEPFEQDFPVTFECVPQYINILTPTPQE